MTMPGGVFQPPQPQGNVNQPLPPYQQPGTQPGAPPFVMPPTQVQQIADRRADMPADVAVQMADAFRNSQQPQQPAQGQQPSQAQQQAGWQYQPVPGQAPPVPQLPGAQVPQQQVQQPQPQQPRPQQPATNDPIIQSGPGVPPELVGRPQSEALRYYSILRQQFTQSQSQQQPAPAQPQQPAQPQNQPTPANRQTDQTFWQDPRAAIREEIRPLLQDAVQQTQIPGQMRVARDTAASMIPGYEQLEPAILQTLAGMDARLLTQPATWINAAKMAMGEQLFQQRMQQGQQQQPAQQQYPQGPAMNGLNSQQQWVPSTGQFFTEAPNGGTPPSNNVGLSPEQNSMASKFNLPPQVYAAWMGTST